MKILVATDAWHPQVNGVVRTLGHVAREARALGVDVDFLTPSEFWTLPMPSYPEIRLALVAPGDIERRLDRAQPSAIHIATEGPLGHAMRRVCIKRGLPFTTSFHTRFPDYLAGRLPVPERWTCDVVWSWMRRFHAPGAAVLAATPTLVTELGSRGFHDVKLWPRGVDAQLYRPRPRAASAWLRPIFLSVGRLAVEKNIEAFLKLDLPGTKLVVGDGPARELQARVSGRSVSGLPQRRGTGGDLRRRGRVRISQPHRYVRPGAAGGAGERRAGRGFPAAAPRDVIGEAAGRRPRRGSGTRVPRRAGMFARRLPRLCAGHDLGKQRADISRSRRRRSRPPARGRQRRLISGCHAPRMGASSTP